MSGPTFSTSRYADKRVAVPIIPRPAVAQNKENNSRVVMPALPRSAAPSFARGSLLNNMTLQEEAAASEPIKKSVTQETARFTPIGFLCRDSEADDGKPAQDPIGTRTGNVSPARPVFSTDTGPNAKWVGGHHVRVSGIKKTSVEETQKVLYAQFDWARKLLAAPSVVPSGANDTQEMYLRFDSTLDAAEAADQVSMVLSSCETSFVLFHEFAAAKGDSGGDFHFYDGQVIFVVEFVGQISRLDPTDGYAMLHHIAGSFGKVLVLAETEQTSTTMEFRIEFDKISSAHKALAAFRPENAYVSNGWKVTTKEMVDPFKAQTSVSAFKHNAHLQDSVIMSPSGRTAWSKDTNGQLRVEQPAQPAQSNSMAMVPYQPQQLIQPYQPMLYGGYQDFDHYGRAPQPYQAIEDYHSTADIFLDEIRSGHDVRTTVMLRNLPNNWGYEDLKDRLDEFCFGTYDFSYLRIDFKKHTNVGYRFVNFERAEDIIALWEGLFDKPWVRGGRGRKANMSYATIQSIDCLIAKFRNSSVQDEFPGFGAKLWYTFMDLERTDSTSLSRSSDNSMYQSIKHTADTAHVVVTPEMVGTERPFPHPDNMTKLQRSNDNAAQHDLWTGQRGRAYKRGGGRGSYSNWDRGTPRQMYEEFPNGMPLQIGYVQVAPYPMVHPYYQQPNNNASHGNNFYQHHSGPSHTNDRRQYQNGSHGGPRDGFVSNDARNDARMPRSFSFENLQASQARGGFNQRGGRIYN